MAKITKQRGVTPLPPLAKSKPKKVSESIVVDRASLLAGQLDREIPKPSYLLSLRIAAEAGAPRAQAEFWATMERKFGHLIAVSGKRYSSVAVPYVITPNPKLEKREPKLAQTQAEFIKEDLQRFDFLTARTAAMASLGYGYSFGVRTFADHKGMRVTKSIEHLGEDRVRFDVETGAPTIDVDRHGNFQQIGWEYLLYDRNYSRSGNPQTNGMFLPTSFYWMMQLFGWKDWALSIERYGSPAVYARVSPTTTDDEKLEIANLLRDLGQDGVAVLANYIEPKMLETSSTSLSGSQFKNFIDATNREISKIWVGQTATVEGTPGQLGAETERGQVAEDLRESDNQHAERFWTQQHIVTMIGLNWGWDDRWIDLPPVLTQKYQRPPDQKKRGEIFAIYRNELKQPISLRQAQSELGMESVEGLPDSAVIYPPAEPAFGSQPNPLQERRTATPAQMLADTSLHLQAKHKDDFETLVKGFTDKALPLREPSMKKLLKAVHDAKTYAEAKRNLANLAYHLAPHPDEVQFLFKALALWSARGRFDAQSGEDVQRLMKGATQ